MDPDPDAALADAPATPRPYVFGQARHLVQAQRRVLAGVHAAFAQTLAVSLSARLRLLVDVVPGEAEAVPFSALLGRPGPSALFVADEAGGHRLALEVAPDLVRYFVGRLFGGGDAEPPEEGPARALSPVEQHLMRREAAKAFGVLARAWARCSVLGFGSGEHARGPAYEAAWELTQLAASEERVVRCPFTVRVQGREGALALVYPLRLLERLLDRGAQQRWQTGGEAALPEETRRAYGETLGALPVELRAELGRVRLRVADLDALAVGDVITLDTSASAPVVVFGGGRPLLLGAPGRAGERFAVRVLESLSPSADTSTLLTAA
ncbi:MAG: flagellar motor switch protein FliM [Rubricoccaceae bacterium]